MSNVAPPKWTYVPSFRAFNPANQNEKKHTPTILEKTKQLLCRVGAKLKSVIADSQYSDEKVRKTVDAVIPYPANQKRGVKGILRVDKKFRSHDPEDLKRRYHKRRALRLSSAS